MITALQYNIINLLNYKTMEANAITLKSVRSEFKSVNIATIGNVLSVIYALVNNYKEKQKEANLNGEQINSLQYFTKILPASKTQAKKYITDIEKFGNVGQFKIVFLKDTDGNIIGHKSTLKPIKPSVDMVLRFFLNMYNEAIPEADMKEKKIKHECATRKPAQCRQKVETAGTVKALNK